MEQFSQKTQEALNYYVYCLVDPRNDKIFYVWKWKDNRVFEHVKCALTKPSISDKLELIREIEKKWKVKHYIIRHNLTEIESLKIEAAIIDLLNYEAFDFKAGSELKNLVSGHYILEGIQKTEELETIYSAKPLEYIEHKLLVININKTYKTADSTYEATRKWRVINIDKAEKIDFILSEYRWIIRAIFKPDKRYKSTEHKKARRCFEWEEVKDEKILKLYLNKSISKKRWAVMPIRYLNPKKIV